MRSTSAYYKTKISSGATRNFEVLIYLNLTDNTQLTITNAEIMDGSFKLMSASSGTESFDIGSAIIGKCTFTLNNFEDDYTDYDFFNATATVWLKLEGDSSYHRMGFYTVDEPTKANSLIQLELLDNMWKFDKDLPTIAYPDTVGNIVYSLCQHCSVALTTVSFNGSSYTIQAAPEQDMNCREYLQYLAMIGCNFCVMDDQGGLCLQWYDMTSYADPTHGSIVAFDKLFSRNVGTAPITVTGIKVRINEQDYLMGNEGYVLVLENPLINEDNVSAILSLIWNRLHPDNQTYFEFTTYNVTMLPDLTPEVGDCVSVTAKDGTLIYSYLTNFTFTPSLCTPSLGAVTPQRSLTRRTSKAVQAAVEVARERVQQEIGYYDVGVQRMNELAINAMGGYTDYDEPATGGRIYYLSNAPITKNAQTGQCEFDDNAVVYKTSGDGFFISTSVDPQTHQRIWTQGYSPSTGLLVEMLTALRINAEQMYTGQMTVGGSQSGVTKPKIRVLDINNTEVCRIDHRGIIMGSGYIESDNYAYTSGHFSDAGMHMDATNSYLRSKYFSFDDNGAYFDGEVNVINHPIIVRGDVDVYNGTGEFIFRPADYYFVEDFPLDLITESGSSTVDLVLHRETGETLIGTYSVTTSHVTTAILNHEIGLDPNDYYRITVTGASTLITVEDAILAYMGTGGFRGTLQGIFKGYVGSNVGNINGVKYDGNTGHFALPSGRDLDANDIATRTETQRRITASMSPPTGGSNGDIDLSYADILTPVSGCDFRRFYRKDAGSWSRYSFFAYGDASDLISIFSGGAEEGDLALENNGLSITDIRQYINGSWISYLGSSSGGGYPDYSYTEQKTGRKWVDGSDIYCKTLPPTNVNPTELGNAIKAVVDMDGFTFAGSDWETSTYYKPLNFYVSSNEYSAVKPDHYNTNVKIRMKILWSYAGVTQYFGTFYYIKYNNGNGIKYNLEYLAAANAQVTLFAGSINLGTESIRRNSGVVQTYDHIQMSVKSSYNVGELAWDVKALARVSFDGVVYEPNQYIEGLNINSNLIEVV